MYSFLYKITIEEMNKTKDINNSLIQSTNKVIIIEQELIVIISHSKKYVISTLRNFNIKKNRINLTNTPKISLK